MADNSANVAKMARILAFIQIITGVLLLSFGIADRLVYHRTEMYGYYSYYYYEWTGYGYFGVWIGVWMLITGSLGIPGSGRDRTRSRNAFMLITGSLGIPGSGRDRTRSRNAFAGVFMGFSITSAVFGGIIIICYSIGIAQITNFGGDYYDNFGGKLAILAFMLILGIVTFAIGIWAAVCTCLLKPCTCCGAPQGDQPMYPYPAGGYVVAQLPSGSVPVTMQADSNVASAPGFNQPIGATGFPQQWDQQFQPRLVNTYSSVQGADEMPPSYGRGGYAPLKNDQTQVMV